MRGRQIIDRVGHRFGRLTVESFVGFREYESGRRRTIWRCRCDCGNYTEVTAKILMAGSSQSCGCLQRERVSKSSRTHGMSRTPMFKVWISMKSRCGNPKDPQYRWYGGRGITVCDAWADSFEQFYADVGPRQKGMSLDRIDNNKGYEPANVRWATVAQQLRNTSRNRWLTLHGRCMTMRDWSCELGMAYATLKGRKDKGWSDAAALTTPVNKALARR